ncbi:rhodanese-like domain-containing protein [Usitatibacter palustris]|uniref:Thiosulfate sulfurtransferase GlpE n=1 Tax=Usitatibacter palustris TaxID=2732487 RepID=A0A6M4H602_9PROT|nr:rhodanese-like domain-containing protein [Usitatibacter palustris]QJR14930.1 Thiosulfate sulfurtransferase GlpE [Usitatibacter palustris]
MANAPVVREIPATELKAMFDRGETFELIDVRTRAERSIAEIHGSRLLDQGSYDALTQLDHDTPLVFTCHHGERSRQAAQHFAQLGFENVSNVSDGIDGWSLSVDPGVRRY